ncbi:MAG: TSUP family transporter [Solirubrobacteraceae bacterium]
MIELAAIGLLAGVASGLLGVGGGVLFVPGLVFVAGLTQVDAEATSLLAIIPVALLGAWRQHRYGNLRMDDGLLIGVLSVAGAVAGVALANVLTGAVLRGLFALLMLAVAGQLLRGAGRAAPRPPSEGDRLS